MHKQKLLVGAIIGLMALIVSPGAQAQYPAKPIRLVVTFPAGGAPDILARIFSEKTNIGQAIVVDNKPGAGGNIGAEIVAKSPGDGYSLVMATSVPMRSTVPCTPRCPTTWSRTSPRSA